MSGQDQADEERVNLVPVENRCSTRGLHQKCYQDSRTGRGVEHSDQSRH